MIMTTEITSTLYRENFRARDYVPIHNMLIMEYSEEDVLLQLVLYSPHYQSNESLYAWHLFSIQDGKYHHVITETAIFDETEYEENQKLPNLKEMGHHFYKRLTANATLLQKNTHTA